MSYFQQQHEDRRKKCREDLLLCPLRNFRSKPTPAYDPNLSRKGHDVTSASSRSVVGPPRSVLSSARRTRIGRLRRHVADRPPSQRRTGRTRRVKNSFQRMHPQQLQRCLTEATEESIHRVRSERPLRFRQLPPCQRIVYAYKSFSRRWHKHSDGH